jgi:hypothetical protein
MEPQQPGRIEANESRAIGLDCRPDRLEPHEQPLPRIGDPNWVGWHEHQPWAAGECLTEPHTGMDPERLCSK